MIDISKYRGASYIYVHIVPTDTRAIRIDAQPLPVCLLSSIIDNDPADERAC